jgi:hypothetical protein
MQQIKARVKQEILRRLRMEHVRPWLPNRICFYGHLITDDNHHPAWLAYRYPSGAEFADFVAKLRKMGYETVSLPEYVASRSSKKMVLMTFDDGYAAIRQHSHAILKALNVPYAVFVHPPGETPPNFPIVDASTPSNIFLSEQDILDLRQEGVHIGFHGNSHLSLSTLVDHDVIAQHVSPPHQMANMLSTPLSYAYPYFAPKDYQRHDQIVMDCGFQHIMDTRGFGNTGNHHFRIPLDIQHSSDRLRNPCEQALLNHVVSPHSWRSA